MYTNRWIADRGYGTGMALAFEGDPEFIRQSVNFAANFLSSKSQIKEQTPSFVLVNTTMDQLREALETEGYLRHMLELRRQLDNPVAALEDDDYPDDFEERVNEFTRAILLARSAAEVAEINKRDPIRGIFEEPTAKMEAEAREWGRNYAEEQIAKIHFEDFMRHINHAPIATHAVVDEVNA